MDDSIAIPVLARVERAREEHYREVAARLRLMADLEPLASVRRHLRWLAKEHDEVADGIRSSPLPGRCQPRTLAPQKIPACTADRGPA
jgi:hypothetical protein